MLIVGASARAAAYSALRAGLEPRCLDHFGDRDLTAICKGDRVDCRHGAAALEQGALRLPPAPWIFTGPLENHPLRVERISRIHRLAGNPAHVLRAARDPSLFAQVLDRDEFPHPETRLTTSGLPCDGTWLVKPLASGGGRLIQPLTDLTKPLPEPSYFQRLVEGTSHSALYLAAGGHSELIGITRLLVGFPGSPFAYRGNVGPLIMPEAFVSRLDCLGKSLTSAFGLVGLFGVDFIEHGGEPWPIEINPRYTASVEIFEMATRRALLGEHLHACGLDRRASPIASRSETIRPAAAVIGKTILYALRDMVAPEIEMDDPGGRPLFAVPSVADVPWPGTAIARGEPIMTLFATGSDAQECADRLEQREHEWRDRLDV